MSSIRIRKRGKSYEYCFDIGKVNNKRKRITNGVRIDIWTHFMRECIMDYVY